MTYFLIVFNIITIIECISSQNNEIPFGLSMRNTVMSGIQDLADFAINIHPPKQDTDEILNSLDGIMLMESAQRLSDNDDFVTAEQKLLKIHKNKISEIVSASFEPIHSMFMTNLEALMRSSEMS